MLTNDINTLRRRGDKMPIPAGVDILYAGSLAMLNTSGYAVAAADTAGCRFAGVVDVRVDNSAGPAGAKSVDVYRTGEFLLTFSGTATQADVGKRVYAANDSAVQLAQPGTGNVLVGEITEYVSATQVWVDITPGVQGRQSLEDVLSGSLTAATVTTGGAVLSLANPYGETVYVTDLLAHVTTKSTGAATVDAGIGATATTSDDTLLDGCDVGTAAGLFNNVDQAGTNGKKAVAWGASQFLTITASATLAGLVGTYKVKVILGTPR